MRRRITLLAAATALFAVLLLAVPLGIFAAHGYVNDERLELQRAAATAAASVRGDHPAVGALKVDRSEITASVYDASARLIDGAGPVQGGALVRAALRGTDATTTGSSGIVVAAPVSDGDRITAVVLLRTDLGAAHHRALVAWLVIAVMSAGAVLVAAFGARLVARRLSAPIEGLRAGARRMGAGDLEARVPTSGVPEFDTLAATLNDTAARIQTMIGRERSLSAEVSHQLRTPLSGLRLDLEALRGSHDDDAQVAAALRSVDRLETTIADVIALARDLPAVQQSSVDVLLAGVEQRWHGLLATETRPLRVSAEPGLPGYLAMSAAATTQVLDILIDNARVHGRGAITVRARAVGTALVVDVSNDGPALTREPHELFRRRDGTRDGGIGLPFARKLAEAENARVTLTAAEPPTFSLVVSGIDARS
ncbi:MAG: sensor histidine kinase [Jatrophihabitantaceae bacterium]